MTEKRKKRKPLNLLATLLFAAALASLLSAAGATLAKYFRSDQQEGMAVAAPFYFSSDKLGEQEDGQYPYYQITDPGAGHSATIEFGISNFVDKLRRTDGSIKYSLAAVSGDDGTAVSWTGSDASGVLNSGSDQTNHVTVTVPRESFGAAQAVVITATATEPYQKTIGAQFGFEPQQYDLQWEVYDKDNIVVLELAGGSGGEVQVTWPPELTPDLSNELLRSASGDTATFTAQPGVRYALTFLESHDDPAVIYDKTSFSVVAVSN